MVLDPIEERHWHFLLSHLTAPGDLCWTDHPRQPISPKQKDDFCKNVLPYLATFRYAVVTGNQTKAADMMEKSLPTVGNGLTKIENNLAQWLNEGNVIDPETSKKAAIPTPAGIILRDFADSVLAESERFLDRLYTPQHATEIHLACIHSAWMAYGPNLIVDYAKRQPGGVISPKIIRGKDYVENIISEVREDKVEVGITSYPPRLTPPLVLQRLQDQEMVLVFSARYPNFPKEKGPIKLADVIRRDGDLKVVIHFLSSDSPLGSRVVRYLKQCKSDLGPSQFFEVHNIAEMKDSIERFPNMISILPADAVAEEVAQGHLRAYSLNPALTPWTWGLVYKSDSARPPIAEVHRLHASVFQEAIS